MEFVVVAVLLVGGLWAYKRTKSAPSSGVPAIIPSNADPVGSGPVPGTGGGSAEESNPTWSSSGFASSATIPGMAGTPINATTASHPTASTSMLSLMNPIAKISTVKASSQAALPARTARLSQIRTSIPAAAMTVRTVKKS
jgi:hypothetical protein